MNDIEIKLTRVDVLRESIEHALRLCFNINYTNKVAVVGMTGKLIAQNGKILSILQKLSDTDKNQRSYYITSEDPSRQREKKLQVRPPEYFIAPLNEISINEIENLRLSNRDKSVSLRIELEINYLISEFDNVLYISRVANGQKLFEVKYLVVNEEYRIEQSEWIREYAEKLSIGNFLLLEYNILLKNNISDKLKENYERAWNRLKKMEEHIKSGDWQDCIEDARLVFEAFKFDKINLPVHKELKDVLKTRFENDGHSEDSFKVFMNSITDYFQFFSKYAHITDKEGRIKSDITAKKEDAYFAYSVCCGFIALLNGKLKN